MMNNRYANERFSAQHRNRLLIPDRAAGTLAAWPVDVVG
jgi:hypothetical protein